MAGVKISYYDLNGPQPTGPWQLGETDGNGGFDLPPFMVTDSFSVQADRNSGPLNGVSTHDLIAINKHILGLAPFDQPWKFVAADANNSRTITTFDIIEIRKLILGLYTAFPTNTAWRFVPDNYVFPDPNPLSAPLPTQVDIGLTPIGFFGIKIGDLNCNATVQVQSGSLDRAPTALALPDVFLASGQTVETRLYAPDGAEWAGFQFALQYDPEKIELENAAPGDLPGLDEGAYARPFPGMLTVSWFAEAPRQIEAGASLFHLRWRAKQPVRLSDAVRFAPTVLHPEVYEADEQERSLVLVFGARPGEPSNTPVIFSPLPNPTGAGANIPVQLDVDTEVYLEIFDSRSKLVFQHRADAAAGMHWHAIPASAMPQPGVFFWRVRAGDAVGTGRLVRH
ncbi:MAG: hypothetical protein ABMA02_10860 [Saprospiraceae bacterium]